MIDVRNIVRPKPKAEAPEHSQVIEKPIACRRSPLVGRVIAFGIDDGAVRMATVRHLGPRRKVLDVREVPIPEGSEDPSQRKPAVQKAISQYLDQFGTRTTTVRAALSGKETAFRTFLMPLLGSKDLDAAVRFEAARQLPFPVDDCHIGFRPVLRVTSGDQSRYKMALYAATRRRIRRLLQPFEDLGVRVEAIHHSHDMIGQLLPTLPDYDASRAYTILTIGSHSSELAFYRGSRLEFFHHTNSGAAMAGEQVDATRLEYFAETLATDIQTSFDYFAGQQSGSATPVIQVCGRLAENDAFIEDLQERVGMRCERFPVESLRGVAYRGEDTKPEAAKLLSVVAAALNVESSADLLPPKDREVLRNRRVDVLGRAAVVALAVILAGGWGMVNQRAAVAKVRAAAVQRQVAVSESSDAYQTVQRLKGRLAATAAYVQKAEKQPTYLALNLKELSHLVLKDLRLTRYDLTGVTTGGQPGDLRMHGVVTSNDIPPEVTLADFVERLAASSFYDSVQVERYVKRERDGAFTIEFQLLMRGLI